ncbi:MAG TPA: ATP-binding protein [Sporichthyaceae bacterium]|nr:ATP-binding protein [Sporichthyaceae bacterium]
MSGSTERGREGDARAKAAVTLRARLRAVLLVGFVVLAVGVLVTSYALSRLNTDTEDLVDEVSPAWVEATTLANAYLNQETGLRGFLLTRDESFLDPYRTGQKTAAAADAAIRRQLPVPTVAAALDAATAAGTAWRTAFADPAVQSARATPASAQVTVNDALGKARFDALRLRLTDLTAAISAERDTARARVSRGLTRLKIVGAAAFLLIALAAVGLWFGLRRLVLRPIGELVAITRGVAGGEFDRPVTVRGPGEIGALGSDVEAMRSRIVAELTSSRRAEAEIRAQAEALDAQSAELAEQAAELRRSNEELEQFAYVASHDLQEPLRKVASFCQLLQKRYAGQLDERADQYIEFAVDGARRMQQLINDLLAFSRVGRAARPTSPVDTAVAARHAMSALDEALTETGAQVELGDLPTLPGDETLLTQLFQNLIGNAVKFRSPDVAPQVLLAARREAEAWHFTCTDNGIGIEADYADRVFVIFQRLHPKDRYPGTGIGLALCRKIVEHHGGRIWLDTGPHPWGRGCVIHWTMPC